MSKVLTKEEKQKAKEYRKMFKFQTNLNRTTHNIIADIAIKEGISDAAVARKFILEGIENYQQGSNRQKMRVAPESCPDCGESKNEIDEPVLVLSGKNWSCSECGARGTW